MTTDIHGLARRDDVDVSGVHKTLKRLRMPMVAYMSFTAYAMTVYHKCIRTSIYATFQGWRGWRGRRRNSDFVKINNGINQKFIMKIVKVYDEKRYGEKVRFKNSSVDRKNTV